MTKKSVTTLAFAAVCLGVVAGVPAANAQQFVDNQLITNGPRASRGDFGDWSARRNVIETAHYDRLLQTNMGFRQARMRRECGPINDPQLRSQCLASFQQYEPTMTGSSLPPRRLRHRWEAGY